MMIESNNPEIDVNELMAQVRAEVGRRHNLMSFDRNGDEASATLLPQIRPVAPFAPVNVPRPIDVKEERLTRIIERAREKTEVSSRIPKIFRRLFRKQGGYNKLLLESVALLAKTNVALNKRLQELATHLEGPNRWLSDLSKAREADATWMKTAATIIASIWRERENLSGTTKALVEQVNTLEQKNASTDDELQLATSAITDQLKTFRSESKRMNDRLSKVQSRLTVAAEMRRDLDRAGEHLRNLQAETDRVTGLLATIQQQIAVRTQHREDLEQQLRAKVEQWNAIQQSVAALDERQASDAAFIKAELSHQAALLKNRLTQAKIDKLAGPGRGKVISCKTDEHQLDAFYFSFENRFRGKREDIKNRVRFYLPFLRKAKIGTKTRPVIDVGCGRGEWLELLREQKLHGLGVDLNEAMVAQCKQRRLKVVLGDAIEFLRNLPDNSQGAVTGFHIIEHLPLEVLIELFRQSRRVLKPGGLAIFESPNCKNLVVGASNFNIDPTHRNPVFPETAQFMLETQGFERVTLQYLAPVDTAALGDISGEPAHLRELLYGPQDFAVIGYTPTAE